MSNASSLSALRLLVIDDDEAIQFLMAAIFRRRDVVVDHALDGKCGLENLRRERYDAIVLDLMLPAMNGFEVIRELKHSQPQLLPRTIVLTAASEMTLRDFDDARFVKCVLRKPFDMDDLIEHVMACRIGALNGERPTFGEKYAH